MALVDEALQKRVRIVGVNEEDRLTYWRRSRPQFCGQQRTNTLVIHPLLVGSAGMDQGWGLMVRSQ